MDKPIPSDVEWVTQRNGWSLQAAFAALSAVVTRDVEHRNAALAPNERKFRIEANEIACIVSRARGFGPGRYMRFDVVESAYCVSVRGGLETQPYKVDFRAEPVISPAGERMFRVSRGDGLLYAWQVSRQALEDELLFRRATR